MEPTPLTMRREALSWWRSLSDLEQYMEWKVWFACTTDRMRKDWPFELVAHSDSAIERLYRESILGENFDN